MPESTRPPHAGSRGPVPAHTADEVTEVAVAIADRSGLAATTVRAVAASLGTAPAALYRYVGARDELVARMVDRALADLTTPPPTGSPVHDLIALTTAQVGVLRHHPWLVDTLQTVPPGPRALHLLDAGLGLLADVDADGAAKLELLGMLTGVATLLARSGGEPDPGVVAAIVTAAPTHPYLAAALSGGTDPSPRSTSLLHRTVESLARGLIGLDADGRPAMNM